ncbi:hypothetical protein KDW_60210 [Dictyobacter vulcani]|uniref:Uncharacterized protein n=1 Tax=Dictyobacter vulcani TaxID=2607529 RepID=A0A5J4L0P1_9CHLR|nr:hypothetical protein KDW_60210 [Dictyobacter vulcani]
MSTRKTQSIRNSLYFGATLYGILFVFALIFIGYRIFSGSLTPNPTPPCHNYTVGQKTPEPSPYVLNSKTKQTVICHNGH